MNINRNCIKLLILIVLGTGTAEAFGNYKTRGLKAYQKQRFHRSIVLFRKYLRRHPKDYQAWNLLASSYFHSGQPDVALRYFKRIIRKSVRKSFNYYYQGLCNEALDRKIQAKQAYHRASYMPDEYGQRSMFQLAVLEYHDRRTKMARFWAQQYLARHPAGIFRSKALNIIYSIDQRKYLKRLKGADMPDMEKALFRYHPYSFSAKIPHYWYFLTGYTYQSFNVINPNLAERKLVNEGFERHTLDGQASIGLGPFRQKKSAAYVGYTYIQKWVSDQDRLYTWLEDFTDISYVPFRPDQLRRHHQVFANFQKDFSKKFGLGIHAYFEVAKVGSGLPPWTEYEIPKVLSLSQTTSLFPWIAYRYNSRYETKIYALLRKVVNKEEPSTSNKTYALIEAEKDISGGLHQRIDFPKANTSLHLEAFHYGFIYNDYWLDHQRQGWMIGLDHNLLKNVGLNVYVGMYTDKYSQPLIKSVECKSGVFKTENTAPSFQFCHRKDQGFIAGIGARWYPSRFRQIEAKISHIDNGNDKLKIYDYDSNLIIVSFTMAFPGVKSILPFLGRFGDPALKTGIND